MGMFDKIFGKKEKISEKELNAYFKMLTGYSPVFTTYEGGLYEMELTRAAIHSFATHFSKLTPVISGSAYQYLDKTLKFQPNPYMNTSQFLYRIATILSIQNTCFIVPIEDAFGDTIQGFYPLLPLHTEVKEDRYGEAWLVYSFAGADKVAVEYRKTAVITQMQYKNDLFGESNSALYPTMQLLHTQREGIIEGVKNSAKIRFMAKAANMFGKEALKKLRKDFTDLNLSSDNNSGIMIFDNQLADVKQVNSEQFVINSSQQKLIQENIFDYFGTNQKILQNNFTEDEWNAYYEGKIEPVAIQLSLAMTNMLCSRGQMSHGNEIMWTANRLQYASNTTKLNIVTQLFDRGFMSLNQGLEIFNMPPVPDGDERYIRGEYINVKDKGEVNKDA